MTHSPTTSAEKVEQTTLEFVQEWMLCGDHPPHQWHRDFAAAIDARAALPSARDAALVEAVNAIGAELGKRYNQAADGATGYRTARLGEAVRVTLDALHKTSDAILVLPPTPEPVADQEYRLADPNDPRYQRARVAMANRLFAINRENPGSGYGRMADELMCGDLMQVPTWVALGLLALATPPADQLDAETVG